MPVKNTKKLYVQNGYYHLYNRGVNKEPIFLDKSDRLVFLNYLKDYLTPKDKVGLHQALSTPHLPPGKRSQILKLLRLKNFSGEIKLMAFGLMPNHFHFELKQISADAIDRFTNCFLNRYSLYFHLKYKKRGPIFESAYKAVNIVTDEQLLQLSRYIHKQSDALHEPSSCKNYLGLRQTSWIYPEEILSYFSTSNPHLSYENFYNQGCDYTSLTNLLLEED